MVPCGSPGEVGDRHHLALGASLLHEAPEDWSPSPEHPGSLPLSGALNQRRWSTPQRKSKICFCSLVTKSCLTFCGPLDCSPPGSSVHGILKARVLEWLAISFSRGSSDPVIEPTSPTLAGRFFIAEPPGKPKNQT